MQFANVYSILTIKRRVGDKDRGGRRKGEGLEGKGAEGRGGEVEGKGESLATGWEHGLSRGRRTQKREQGKEIGCGGEEKER